MRINSVSQQSFGARPNNSTKFLLYQLESNGINTKPYADIINKMYVGENICTEIADSGRIKIDIFDKEGIHKVKVFEDKLKQPSADYGTHKLINPELFGMQLKEALINISANRDCKQKILDKVNSQFHEGL